MVSDFSKSVTMRAIGRAANPGICYRLKPLLEPEPCQICYILDENLELRPIKILGGRLWGSRGFSNVWNWIDLETGKEDGGYGGFYILERVESFDQT